MGVIEVLSLVHVDSGVVRTFADELCCTNLLAHAKMNLANPMGVLSIRKRRGVV